MVPLRCVRLWSWAPRGRGYRVADLDGAADVASLHDVGVLVASGLPRCILVVEGLYVGPGRASSLALAEYAAQVYGPLLEHADGDVLRPLAGRWRARVLRLPRCSAAAAERYAVAAAPLLVSGLGRLGAVGHVAEAACLAYYGWATRRTT